MARMKGQGFQKAFCARTNPMEVRFNETSNFTRDYVILLGHGMPRIECSRAEDGRDPDEGRNEFI